MSGAAAKNIYKVVCILTILIVAAIRIHLANIPFERDEGEYAYAGQMILKGSPPYQHVYNMKFPGTYFMYAASFKFFGESVSAPRYLVLALQLISAFFIFLLARRAIHPLAGWLTAPVFMLFNLSLALQGTQANAEHFLLVFLVSSLYFLYRCSYKKPAGNIFISGVLIALACLMKQHAFVFAFAAALWIVYVFRWQSARYLLAYAAGGLLPVLLVCLYLWRAGVWARFYFLTIQYARAYVGLCTLAAGAHNLNRVYLDSTQLSPLLTWLTFISIFCLLLPFRLSKTRLFLLLLLLASALAVTPGLYFRRHYFLIMTPLFALVFAYAAFLLTTYLNASLRFLMLSAYIALNAFLFMHTQRDCFFNLPPDRVIDWIYPGTPFAMSGQIAGYIKNHSLPADRICIAGVEPQLFFLSQRRSASGYIYIYPLLENQPYAERMTDEFIAESEQAKPAILVFSTHSAFEDGANRDSKLYKWYRTFKEKYKLIATCSAVSESDYRFSQFDSIAPVDTFSANINYVAVYRKIE